MTECVAMLTSERLPPRSAAAGLPRAAATRKVPRLTADHPTVANWNRKISREDGVMACRGVLCADVEDR